MIMLRHEAGRVLLLSEEACNILEEKAEKLDTSPEKVAEAMILSFSYSTSEQRKEQAERKKKARNAFLESLFYPHTATERAIRIWNNGWKNGWLHFQIRKRSDFPWMKKDLKEYEP